jgi:hypothetical protein
VFWGDEHLDAASHAWLTSNEACTFQGQHHLVDRRRGDDESPLNVGFGGRPLTRV